MGRQGRGYHRPAVLGPVHRNDRLRRYGRRTDSRASVVRCVGGPVEFCCLQGDRRQLRQKGSCPRRRGVGDGVRDCTSHHRSHRGLVAALISMAGGVPAAGNPRRHRGRHQLRADPSGKVGRDAGRGAWHREQLPRRAARADAMADLRGLWVLEHRLLGLPRLDAKLCGAAKPWPWAPLRCPRPEIVFKPTKKETIRWRLSTS